MHLLFCIYSDPLFIWCGSGCGCYCSLCPLCGSTNDVHAWQFWLLIIYFFRIAESKRARCWWGEQGVPSSAGSLCSQFWGWPPLHRSSEHILCGHGFLAFHRQLPGGLFSFYHERPSCGWESSWFWCGWSSFMDAAYKWTCELNVNRTGDLDDDSHCLTLKAREHRNEG